RPRGAPGPQWRDDDGERASDTALFQKFGLVPKELPFFRCWFQIATPNRLTQAQNSALARLSRSAVRGPALKTLSHLCHRPRGDPKPPRPSPPAQPFNLDRITHLSGSTPFDPHATWA